ncbi:alpha/beta fold hydrolase [Streptomyces sp. P9-2B-2]|uniref:thioesterase II family protein n=1 Tax=Streptomyces sp. P9-2B-2 TaxID=3057114 RepID=UPI0025B2E8E5|nr:alpha/beta fold hydrolase [Streptomyces sp. P9-2B-2]WJY37080.1 alpha/beta fold hydrolase [Streptomyces sp. P9-2B-2]
MRTAKPTPSELWLRPCNTPVQRPRLRLVCLPHAGGTAHSFRSWAARLPADIGVYAVQYPGRQDRFIEPLIDDMEQMVEPIVAALEPLTGEPLVIFGHSMGAYVAYEVTAELERRHGQVVDLLAVSGASPPHHKGEAQIHKLSDAELIADLKRVNASLMDLLAQPDLVEVLLPMIRADYRLSERYERLDPVPVKAELVAVGGTADSEVDRGGLEAWSAFAADRFEVIELPGGHFYLFDDEAAVTGVLAARLPGAAYRPMGG